MQHDAIIKQIDQSARDMGLKLLGVADLQMTQDYLRYERWVDSGAHAGMAYMEQNKEVRLNPSRLLEGAKSAIVFGLNYYQGDLLSDTRQGPIVAQYARLKDYHKFLKRKAEVLLQQILNQCGDNHAGRVLVDSAPLFERSLAARTHKGFIGKNTLYIHPEMGSFFLLGEILTTIPLASDAKTKVDPRTRDELGGCGSCQRCQVNCPTGALDKDYFLDANKCISYWTIEHRGPIPEAFWPHLKTYLFGCDLCQLACPYNRKQTVNQKLLEIQRIEKHQPLPLIATMDQKFYEKHFGGTPMTRAKRSGLMRNALIAMYVTGHPELSAVIRKLAVIDLPEDLKGTFESIAKKITS